MLDLALCFLDGLDGAKDERAGAVLYDEFKARRQVESEKVCVNAALLNVLKGALLAGAISLRHRCATPPGSRRHRQKSFGSCAAQAQRTRPVQVCVLYFCYCYSISSF